MVSIINDIIRKLFWNLLVLHRMKWTFFFVCVLGRKLKVLFFSSCPSFFIGRIRHRNMSLLVYNIMSTCAVRFLTSLGTDNWKYWAATVHTYRLKSHHKYIYFKLHVTLAFSHFVIPTPLAFFTFARSIFHFHSWHFGLRFIYESLWRRSSIQRKFWMCCGSISHFFLKFVLFASVRGHVYVI